MFGSPQPEDNVLERIGGAEIVGRPSAVPGREPGRYNEQQDAVSFINISQPFFTLQRAARKNYYKQAFSNAAQEYNDKSAGTCALVAGACYSDNGQSITAHAANLGDSVALLVVYDRDGNIVKDQCRMLNSLHNRDNSSERKRVEDRGGAFNSGGYLVGDEGSGLAVTRSIGDAGFSEWVSSDPEYIEDKVILKDGQKAVLVVACDGLLEGPFSQMKEDSHGDGRKKYCDVAVDWMSKAVSREDMLSGDPGLIACKLTKQAAETSRDNISVLVQRLEPKTKTPLMVVCDGHGGKEVALGVVESLSQHLGGRLDCSDDPVVREEQPASMEAVDQFIQTKAQVKTPASFVTPDILVDWKEISVPRDRVKELLTTWLGSNAREIAELVSGHPAAVSGADNVSFKIARYSEQSKAGGGGVVGKTPYVTVATVADKDSAKLYAVPSQIAALSPGRLFPIARDYVDAYLENHKLAGAQRIVYVNAADPCAKELLQMMEAYRSLCASDKAKAFTIQYNPAIPADMKPKTLTADEALALKESRLSSMVDLSKPAETPPKNEDGPPLMTFSNK